MKLRNYFPTPGLSAFQIWMGSGIGGLLLICALVAPSLSTQTILSGHVSDSNEALIGATVKVSQAGTFIRGTITDYNGDYRIQLDPGTYDLEISFTGFKSEQIAGVRVLEGQITTQNVIMSNSTALEEVIIAAYKVPLIEKDQTSSGQTLTSDQIKNLPTRNIHTIVANTVGASSVDGGNVNIKGARSNGTDTYIDGIRISGGLPPVQDLKQLQVITGGIAADKLQASPAPTVAIRTEPKKEEIPGWSSQPDPIDDVSGEQYNRIIENPFQDARSNGISTFSIDVDAASYANIRRYLNANQLPPRDAVRLEEMINYFDYQYEAPRSGRDPFEVHTEVAPCPWNPKNRLMTIGIQGEKIDMGQLPASNLVFLIDVSGSMGSENKLPLVKQSLLMLIDQLRPNDRVAIVVYAGAAGLVLESTSGADKPKIKASLEALQSGGSTAGGAGIKLAYETARKNLISNGNNRVILCSDGDFNVGQSSEDELVKLIENERKSGVYLTILGYGMGNYQDGKMQSLADKGNGNHAYIDQLSEAKKVLMQEFGGTLFAIAKDVKLQVHFNPAHVAGYRLIGYENRMLATEDFNNDAKDAGELGVGHRVTAIYEIVPAGQSLPSLSKADSALVVVTQPDTSVTVGSNDLMVLQLRYKKPKGEQPSKLMEYRLNAAAMDRKTESENFLLASSIAEFGLLLRDSKYKASASYEHALSRAREAAKNDPNGYRTELVHLMEKAQSIAAPVGTAKK
jgi:Ca-activated chloride channel family protein